MIEKILENGMEWDVAFYGDLVAFKNSCDRTTTIYPKRYWLSRMRDSFQKLDTIQLQWLIKTLVLLSKYGIIKIAKGQKNKREFFKP